MILRERVDVGRSLTDAVALFNEVPEVISCIPGASVIGKNDDGSYRAVLRAKYGEVGVQFAGTIRGEQTGPDGLRVHAEGNDGHNVRAVGDIRLAFAEQEPGMTTIQIVASLSFSGMFTTLAYAATKAVGPQLMQSFGRCLASKASVAPSP